MSDSPKAQESKVELLWKRLEDAKLQVDFCHNYVRETKQDTLSTAIPPSDGNYAHLMALRDEETALQRYLTALHDLKAALMLEKSSDGTLAVGAAVTPREREVLILIAEGLSTKQIAARLGVAFRTVVCHRYRLYRKMQVHSCVELTHIAMRMGLVKA